jgi:hypothetical protein
LLDIDRAAQVNQQPATVGAGPKKEILRWLVILGRDSAVVELIDVAAIVVLHAIHDREPGFRGGVVFGRRRDVFEFEAGRRVFATVGDRFDLGVRDRPEYKDRYSGDHQDMRFHAIPCSLDGERCYRDSVLDENAKFINFHPHRGDFRRETGTVAFHQYQETENRR